MVKPLGPKLVAWPFGFLALARLPTIVKGHSAAAGNMPIMSK